MLKSKGAVLLFDLTRPMTLEYLEEWISKLRSNDSGIPIILVGTKIDLVERITEIDDLANIFLEKYSLSKYFKVNSKTGENLEQAFEVLIIKMWEHEKQKKRKLNLK